MDVTMESAEAHFREGRYDEALECFLDLLDDITDEFGPTHENTLGMRCRIATVLVKQEKYVDALRDLIRVYRLRLRTLGFDHLTTVETREYVIDLLQQYGTREITSQIFQEVEYVIKIQLKIMKEFYMEGKYKDTLDSAFDIWNEVEAFFGENCLPIQKLGLMMARAFSAREEYGEAIKVLNDVYRQRRVMFGHNNRRTAIVLMKKASVLHRKCEFEDAMRLYCEAHDIRKDVLGLTHRKTLLSLLCMAKVTASVGNHSQALVIMDEVCRLQTQNNYKEALRTTLNVGLSFFAQREYDRALEIFKEASKLENLSRRTKAMIQNTIGKLLTELGRFSEARLVLMKVIKMRKSTHFHMETLSTYRDIAINLAREGKRNIPCTMLKMLIAASARLSDPLNSVPLSIQTDLAMLYFSRSQYNETLYILSKIWELQYTHIGQYHPAFLNTKFQVAKVYRRQGRFDDALKMYNEIRDLLHAIYYPEHSDILTIEVEIGETYLSRNAYSNAFNILYENYEKNVKIYGLDHPYTKNIDDMLTSFVGEIPLLRLITATMFENLHDVRTFLEDGDDVNGRDVNGATALHYASRDGCFSILRYLLSKGAIYNIKDINGKTPEDLTDDGATKHVFRLVQSLFQNIKLNNHENVRRILQAEDSLVNARDELRRTPLQWAIAMGDAAITDELLNRGADVMLANKDDGTVLHTAARRGESEILATLLRHIRRNRPREFHKLLNDKNNVLGLTALHLASKESYLECVNLLIEYNANPMIYDVFGKVPFDFAIDEEVNFSILMYAFSFLNIYHRRYLNLF